MMKIGIKRISSCLLVLTVFAFVLTPLSAMPPQGIAKAAVIPDAAVSTLSQEAIPIYLDETYSHEERAADLVSRMTLKEKISQIQNETPAIPRLGIKKYVWWSEALHGVAGQRATSFPSSLSMSLSWDRELMLREGAAISDEARAYNKVAGKGLSYWSPTVNLARDPRWGRNEETYGEDALLTSAISGAFIEGMQGTDSKYLKTVATVKHYMANNSEDYRHNTSSNLTGNDLHNYYAVPYRNAVLNSKVYSLMTGYNAVNGIPVSANTYLLDTLLRKTWGFNGYVVSDCGAISDVYLAEGHHWSSDGSTPSVANAAGACITAGTDLAGTWHDTPYTTGAEPALQRGYLTEEAIDKAVYRLMLARMKLGEFDATNVYSHIDSSEIEAADHGQIAEEAALAGVVLLKNQDNILPIDPAKSPSIGVIGAGADDVILGMGAYAGHPSESNKTAPLQGLKNAVAGTGTAVNYYQVGSTDTRSFLFNYQKVELYDKDGNLVSTLDSNNYSSYGGGIMDEGDNFGYVEGKNNPYVVYSGVDLTKVVSFKAYTSTDVGSCKGGNIELHYGSQNGGLVGTTQNTTTTGWSDYKPSEGAYTGAGMGYNGPDATLYVCFTEVNNNVLSDAQKQAVAQEDYVICYAYTTEATAGEGKDRQTLDLPEKQAELILSVAEVNPNVIVYIQTLGMVDVSSFADKVKGIFFTGYNGQAQGKAFGELITGKANPSGSLSFTWINDESKLGDINDYGLAPSGQSLGRTYQYYTGDYQWPFGYGLSYTDFEIANVKANAASVDANGKITVTANVKNIGGRDGGKAIQLYAKTPKLTDDALPAKRLVAFEKVSLKAGESQTVTFTVDCADLAMWSEIENKYVVAATDYLLEVATSAEDSDVAGGASVTVTGKRKANLQAVTLDTNGVSLNGIGERMTSEVTVSLDDDSIIKSGYTVTYSSSNPAIATVDKDGTITGKGIGTTRITATVTYNGQTERSTVGVAVTVDVEKVVAPEAVTFNGVPFTQYAPTTKEYYVLVENSDEAPTVDCVARENTTYTVKQAGALPSDGVLTVTYGETEVTYTFHFIKDTSGFFTGDDFTSETLSDKWTVLRENKAEYTYQAGKGITITTTATDLSYNGNTTPNIFVQKANGDWVVEAKLSFSQVPRQTYQQGGIYAYQNDDNFVKLALENGGDMGMLKFQTEVGGQPSSDYFTAFMPAEFANTKSLYLRLEKDGNVYKAHYSLDGTVYTEMGAMSANLADVNFGFSACHVVEGTAPIQVTLHYLNVVSDLGYVTWDGSGELVKPAYGDVNGDGGVDAKDALLILQAAVGKAELTQDQTVKADVNGDEAIDAKDALLVLQKAVDKIEKFPVEE